MLQERKGNMADTPSGAEKKKAQKWIEEKRDPRSAYWQAGLESVMDLFAPNLEKGRITPVGRMEERDITLFRQALEKVDICPSIYAAFLPQAIADTIVPPETAEETWRVEKDKASCKIIILRPGDEKRILSAEISDQAHKPGVDIFQSGALLGSYDYENTEDCLNGLNKAVKAHAWNKDTWQREEIIAYTLNWFERVMFLNSGEVSVDTSFSFFHSPTLIRTKRVDGLFQIFYILLTQQYDAMGFLAANPVLAERVKEKDSDFCRTFAREHVLEYLNLVKDLKLMDFSDFTEKENREFQNEFVRIEERLRDRLMHLKN